MVRWGIVQTDEADELARAVALLIAAEQAAPSAPATTAVLCRNNRQVRRIVAAARALSLPVRWNARRYMQRSQAVGALLSYAEHLMGGALEPAAIESVLAWLAMPADAWVSRLAVLGDLQTALVIAQREDRVDPRFLRRDAELRAMSPGVPLRRKLRTIINNLDLLARLRHGHPDGIEADALEALLEVVDHESEYLTLGELRTLVRLSDCTAGEPDPNWRTSRITVLTVHDAKGLEWDSVHLPFFEHAGGRAPEPVLTEPQSSTTVRVGVRDIRRDNDPRRVLTASERLAALAEGASLTRLPDGVYSEFSHRIRVRERDEAIRLDYVAVTRARHRLTIAIASADGKWPLSLKHLYDAVAQTRAHHTVSALTGPLARPPGTSVHALPPSPRRQPIEAARALIPPATSPTRLERLINGR
jgi:ATP-dependent exoDNAse (exonuclease V) beta subunit